MLCEICGRKCMRRGTRQKYCSVCSKKSKNEYSKEYMKNLSKERRRKYSLIYKQNHSQEIKLRDRIRSRKRYPKRKKYEQDYKVRHKEEIAEYMKRYRHIHKESTLIKLKEYRKNRDIMISISISSRIRKSIKHNKNGRHWEDIVGFTLEELKLHLEKQFKGSITWKNYGTYWHIDHRIPISMFNFNSYEDEEFKKCWALENLKPMIGVDNLRKHNKYSEPTLNQILESITS